MDPASISGIKNAARACSDVRRGLLEWVKPGISTADIDRKAVELIKETGAVSAVYGREGFPGHICICLNSQVAHFHGREDVYISTDDLIKIDVSLRLESWVADCGASLYLGDDSSVSALTDANRQAVVETAQSLCPGLPVSDIPDVIDCMKESYYYYRELTGHGTGSELHTSPLITAGSKEKLRAGQIIALEAVFAAVPGRLEYNGLEISSDSLNAHHEETVLITANGSEILTLP